MASTSENPGNCITESYTGSVCRQQLLAWQECAVGSAGDVFLDLTLMEQPQEERERDAAQFLHFLGKLTRLPIHMHVHASRMFLIFQ